MAGAADLCFRHRDTIGAIATFATPDGSIRCRSHCTVDHPPRGGSGGKREKTKLAKERRNAGRLCGVDRSTDSRRMRHPTTSGAAPLAAAAVVRRHSLSRSLKQARTQVLSVRRVWAVSMHGGREMRAVADTAVCAIADAHLEEPKRFFRDFAGFCRRKSALCSTLLCCRFAKAYCHSFTKIFW
jgi:hypothetical protein